MAHDFRLEGLIMRVFSNNEADNKKAIETLQLLTENIDKHTNSRHLYKKVYKKLFNNHLQDEECHDYIECLGGSIWTLKDTNTIAEKLDVAFKDFTPEEFRTAMHKFHNELDVVLRSSSVAIEATVYGKLAAHYLTKYGGSVRLVDDYFYFMKCYDK